MEDWDRGMEWPSSKAARVQTLKLVGQALALPLTNEESMRVTYASVSLSGKCIYVRGCKTLEIHKALKILHVQCPAGAKPAPGGDEGGLATWRALQGQRWVALAGQGW